MKPLRTFLIMLALGLASVPFLNGIYDKLAEISVELPEATTDVPIFVLPKYRNEIPRGGGGGSAFHEESLENNQIKSRKLKSKITLKH